MDMLTTSSMFIFEMHNLMHLLNNIALDVGRYRFSQFCLIDVISDFSDTILSKSAKSSRTTIQGFKKLPLFVALSITNGKMSFAALDPVVTESN